MLRLDDISSWEPALDSILRPHVLTTATQLQREKPEFVEDALSIALGPQRDAIIDATLAWLAASHIAAYHGTRLTPKEVEGVRVNGLLPLLAERRIERLSRALSRHPNWPDFCGRLPEAIEVHRQPQIAGRREGQVHLTLSRVGLIRGFNHYLMFGSEFDKHVAHSLAGADGLELLALDGSSVVIEISVPGVIALRAAHPYFGISDLRLSGDTPNIIREFLGSWAFRKAHPTFTGNQRTVDCGMLFKHTIPAEWIQRVDPHPIDESDLRDEVSRYRR